MLGTGSQKEYVKQHLSILKKGYKTSLTNMLIADDKMLKKKVSSLPRESIAVFANFSLIL
jgi:hypothetical protein